MASFVKSNKDRNKLVYEGFIYVNYKTKANKRLWRCEFWRSCKCRGTAATDLNSTVTVGQQHNHGPSPTRIELVRVKSRISLLSIQHFHRGLL